MTELSADEQLNADRRSKADDGLNADARPKADAGLNADGRPKADGKTPATGAASGRDPQPQPAPAPAYDDARNAERGLLTLVLTLVELLRQLMERQALRRVDVGDLSDDQIERIGSTLMHLEQQMQELCDHFGIRLEELNLDLGPLGTLLPATPPAE